MAWSRRHATALLILLATPAWGDPGREFYAVYALFEGISWPMHVFVCNPDPAQPATVTVDTESGTVATTTVPPGSCEVVLVTDQRKAYTTVEAQLAYRVTSDRPVYAQQFTDAEAFVGVPSGLRLPDRSELGTAYLVLALPGLSDPTRGVSLLTVIAPGGARVAVTVAADTQAGGVVPALRAGDTYTTDLPPYGVLQLAGASVQDLTGSVVRADAPVQVLGGCLACAVAAVAPSSEDALEALPPEADWGTRYVVAATWPTTVAPNLIRILARADGTTVTTDPAQPGTPAELDRGGYLDLVTTADFMIEATAPVLVGRVEGRGTSHPGDVFGDPALIFLLPAERFHGDAVFSLPDFFFAVEHYLDVVTHAGASVTVDGSPVPAASLVPVGDGAFVHASLPLVFGRTHMVAADRPMAAYASARFGWSAVSYLVDAGCQVAVPPEVSRVGSPLLLARRGLEDVLFSWEDQGSAASAYHLYQGTIRTIWDHGRLGCDVQGTVVGGGRREAVLPVSDPGYFLVSASTCGGEGETGGDPARSDCPP